MHRLRNSVLPSSKLDSSSSSRGENSVLVDNGDLIQGNPIADYQAAKGYKEGKPNPAVDCLNAMHYEVGTLGNHEFNYGLDYLAGCD